jgi:hypothetical protein
MLQCMSQLVGARSAVWLRCQSSDATVGDNQNDVLAFA